MRFWPRNTKRFKNPVMVQLSLEEAEELRKELDALGVQVGPPFQKFVAYRLREGLVNCVAKVKSQ